MIHRYIFKVLLFHISCPKEISRCLSQKKDINTCCNTEATFALQPIKTHKFMSPSNHHLIAQEVPKPWNLFTFYKEHPNKNLPLSHRNQPRGSKLAKGNGVHPYHIKWLPFPVSRMGHPSVPSKWKAAGFLNYSIWTHWTLSEHTVNHKLQKYASPILVQPASSQNSSLLPCISSSQEIKYVQSILSCLKTLDRSSTLG